MGVINDPDLSEIGRGIIGEDGFRLGDDRSLRRAWRLWTERTTPMQRHAAEQVWFMEWLRGLHREQVRQLVEARGGMPVALPAADRPGIIPGRVVDDERSARVPREHGTPVTELAFQSESPGLREPEPSRPALPVFTEPAREPRRPEPATPRFGPVVIGNVRDRAPVQQPSRKVAQYQHMFPELGRPVATATGPKALAECDAGDLEFRIAEVAGFRQSLRTANSTDEARIDGRERLNARDRVRIAERQQNMREARVTEERLEKAARALEEHGVTLIGELPADALDEIGFKRRVA